MKYLLNNKVYDTEKAEKIIEYAKSIAHINAFVTTYPMYKHTLYKTKKGQFFVHIGECFSRGVTYSHKNEIKLLSEDEVKAILIEINEIELYKELFGDLEEG